MRKATTIILGLTLFIYSFNIAVGQEQVKIDKASAIAKQFLKDQQIPGMAISVSKKGKLIWSKGFGYSDLKTQKK